MTIEIANRLVEYRKKNHLSQEEVAEQIGVSRQAVSKWERAEASPDTDNLIALASLYHVSLDELILGKTVSSDGEKTDRIPKTIFVETEDTTVTVSNGHLQVREKADFESGNEEDGDGAGFHAEIKLGADDTPARSSAHRFFRSFPFPVLTLIAYLIFGVCDIFGGWAWGWLVFLLIPVYYTFVESVFLRKADHFAFPVLITLVYCWLGFEFGLWHPMWILFLTIPFYYFLCEFFSKLRSSVAKKENEPFQEDGEG